MKILMKYRALVAPYSLSLRAVLIAPAASADVIYNFQQGVDGYTGAASTYTEYQGDQSFSWGGSIHALSYSDPVTAVAKKVAFMRFDLNSIAMPVTVNSASLSLYVEENPIRTGDFNQVFHVYSISRDDLNFGTVDGATENGALSFNYSSYNSTTPGASTGWGKDNNITWGPVAGEDYGLMSIGSFTLTSANAIGQYVTFSLDMTTVASWINSPSSNLGFVIVAEAVTGAQAQAVIYTGNAWEAVRPSFIVDVTPIPEPGVISMLGAAAAFSVALSIFKRRRLVA